MKTKDILEYDKHSISMHRLDFLENLVGRRFGCIESLKEQFSEEVNLFLSESERLEGFDYMLDGEFDEHNSFTLFYLLDNKGLIYITEISFNC